MRLARTSTVTPYGRPGRERLACRQVGMQLGNTDVHGAAGSVDELRGETQLPHDGTLSKELAGLDQQHPL